jgi:hypothetical protein
MKRVGCHLFTDEAYAGKIGMALMEGKIPLKDIYSRFKLTNRNIIPKR